MFVFCDCREYCVYSVFLIVSGSPGSASVVEWYLVEFFYPVFGSGLRFFLFREGHFPEFIRGWVGEDFFFFSRLHVDEVYLVSVCCVGEADFEALCVVFCLTYSFCVVFVYCFCFDYCEVSVFVL